MARTSIIIAGMASAGFFAVAAGLALTPGPADAGYGVASRPSASNTAAKSDMLAVNRKAPNKAIEVAEIRKAGEDFILLDAKGRVVYRSERAKQKTTVAKDADVPLITGYGVATKVETAFEQQRD